MWFRNLYLFKLDQPFNLSAEELQQHLEQFKLSDCPPGQRETLGWTSPFGRNHDLLVLANPCNYLIRLSKRERILPAGVINDHLVEKIELIEARDERKVGGKERRELKEQLEFELLPKAFIKNSHIDAWIDCKNGWLIVNTSTASKAEVLTKALRAAIGNLPLSLPEPTSSPFATMTSWLNQNRPPSPFDFGYECLFKSMNEEASTVTFRRHALTGDELRTNLDAGKIVSQLELNWKDRIRFILTDDLLIKRLKFLDIMTDNLDQQGFESKEEKLDAEFALMTGEVSQLLNDLSEQLQI